ncbi:uncharacterized protein LOC144553871 [Carex rostrata]
MTENNVEYLQITSIEYGQKIILEKLEALSSGLYCTNINPIESNMVSNQKLLDTKMFTLWHDRLGHPEPLTGDVFTARFADCQFDETIFPILGGEKEKLVKQEATWNASSISYLDPRSGQCESEVQKIIHLQRIANELLDAFTDTKRVTTSHVPALNATARIDVIPAEVTIQRKRGRPTGSKDKNPRKKKEQNKAVGVPP